MLSQGNVQIINTLRFWLEIVDIDTNLHNEFLPDKDAGFSGQFAALGLLPPCESGFTRRFQCTDPGRTAWVVKFCLPGTTTIEMVFTLRAFALTLIDAMLGDLGIDVSTLIDLITDLEEEVPLFADAIACFSTRGLRRFRCAGRALFRLARDREQRVKLLEILKDLGINLTAQQMFKLLIGAGISAFQIVADDVRFISRTRGRNILTLEVEGQ